MNAREHFDPREMTANTIGRELPPPSAPSGPSDEQLEQARVDGYNAAAQGQPESDCPVMDGQLCIQWVKGWKQWHEEQNPQTEE